MGCLLKDELEHKYKDERSQSFQEKEDILTDVLGPKHYGQVHAKGEGVTPTVYFNVPRKSITKDALTNRILEERFESERKLRDDEKMLMEDKFKSEKEYLDQLAKLEEELWQLKTMQSANHVKHVFEKISFSAQNFRKENSLKSIDE